MEAFVDGALKWLLAQGGLGIMLGLLGYGYWKCRDQVKEAWQERFSDYGAVLEAIKNNSSALADVVESQKARTNANEAMAKANEMSAAEIGRLNGEAIRYREAIADMKTEIQVVRNELMKLREELVRRGLA